ncbi:hypothetical protein PENSPDRAFT_305942 [Peniophora sp. CONT]|nr:hypothetical protein PENSPDRAFT_305942 [Peniophora sp. CONT]
MSVIVEEEDYSIIRLKSSVDRAWKDLVTRHGGADNIPEDRDWDYATDMAHWHVYVEDEASARVTVGARALKKVYDDMMEKERMMRDVEDHWWYEVTMQRQKPEGENKSALEVLMEWDDGQDESQVEGKGCEGVWWITGIKWADEAEPALKYFGNNIPYDNPNPC